MTVEFISRSISTKVWDRAGIELAICNQTHICSQTRYRLRYAARYYYRIRPILSFRHAHGDLCKHLGIDSSTDLDDRYSNLFLNAKIVNTVTANVTMNTVTLLAGLVTALTKAVFPLEGWYI